MFKVEIFKTQYYKHAYENTLKLTSGEYDGILCCSGDGIIHEVINAMMERIDNLDIPIGVLPAGSSNGLAKVICEESKEEFSLSNCAYIICKGQTKNFDLTELEMLRDKKTIYSFLSINWTIVADIDLESEVY